MKKRYPVVIVLLLIVSFVSCKKNDAANKSDLQASKTNSIQKGEPVSFTFPQTASGVKWSVSPASNVQINYSGNKTSILFGEAKEYTISAQSNGTTASTKVSVNNDVFNTATQGGTLVPFADGEQFKIDAFTIDSGTVYKGVGFSVRTTKEYLCYSSFIVSEMTKDKDSYIIKYSGVNTPDGCTEGKSNAGTFQFLNALEEGTTKISIVVKNKTFSGTIERSGKSITLNWPDASVIKITPTSLSL